MSEILGEIWGRATTAQPVPDTLVVLALALAALLLVAFPPGYRVVRHLVTLIHEAGHALVALLCGRRLQGIRLHSDTSGVTVSRGRPRGPGMIATVAAGYPAPAVFGFAAAWLLSLGYAVGLLWLMVLACLLMALQIRNLYGLAVVGGTAVALASVSWWLDPVVLFAIALLLVWALLFSAPRSVIELARQRRRTRSRSSDADQLAALTPLPAVLWVGLFFLVTSALLIGGTAILLGQLLGG